MEVLLEQARRSMNASSRRIMYTIYINSILTCFIHVSIYIDINIGWVIL